MRTFIAILLSVAFVCVVGSIEALTIMALWNYVLCAIFTTLPTISFWLAWGIFLILDIIGSIFKLSAK
jgi:hypothetical protein